MNKRNAFFADVFTRELNRWKQEEHKNQETFAAEIGVEPNMITRYKKGKAHPNQATLQEICRVLQVEASIFYPKSFEDLLKYDEATQEKVKLLVQEMEQKTVYCNGINLLFWEFLWQTMPNIKGILPSAVHDLKDEFLFPKQIENNIEFFNQSDLDYIRDLQNDVVNYMYMQTIKYALGQHLEKVKSQAACDNCFPEKQELNRQWDNLFSMILLELLRNPKKEESHGID